MALFVKCSWHAQSMVLRAVWLESLSLGTVWPVLNYLNGRFAALLSSDWRIDLWLCVVCPKNCLGTVWN